MTDHDRALPLLPLLLWKTPPALATILEQEGIPHRVVDKAHTLSFRLGRFVLFDRRQTQELELRGLIRAGNTAIDIDTLRDRGQPDPFEALLETKGRRTSWRLEHFNVTERVSLHDRARIRRALVERLGGLVTKAGGLWARLSPYPFPYRSAFNLRVDLDEHAPDDYFAFASARTPIEDATTHFVSTHAYGEDRDVLNDLRRLDTHSHGHYHVVYREAEANRVNLRRALDRLDEAGIVGDGFAAPHGSWNPGLDAELEELGCGFSSEFQVGYDDLPFFPWTGSRRSSVLQVPVHPICEGLFFDAGATDAEAITDHLTAVVRAKIAAGEPAFIYGHPERRLGRFPGVVSALAATIAGESLTWRVGLSEFVRWWRWRLARSWSIVPKGDGRFEVQFEEWDARYPLGLEVVRGRHTATLPIQRPVTAIDVHDLAYERRPPAFSLPPPLPRRRDLSLRAAIRDALDWETVTPIEDLPAFTFRSRLRRELRAWRERSRAAV
jgi:hypothetical protein